MGVSPGFARRNGGGLFGLVGGGRGFGDFLGPEGV